MTKEEMNKEKAEVLKNVLDYKNAIQTIKKDLDGRYAIVDGFIAMGLMPDASIKLKNACIELARCHIQDEKNNMLYLINLIDNIGDALIEAYGNGLKEMETED